MSGKSVLGYSKPPIMAKKDSVQKLLATSVYADNLRSVVKSGSLSRKIKLVSLYWRVKLKRG